MHDHQQAAIEAANRELRDASYEFDRWLAAHDREVDGDFGPYTKKGLQSLLAR